VAAKTFACSVRIGIGNRPDAIVLRTAAVAILAADHFAYAVLEVLGLNVASID